mmetsp:Transcript_28266/g.32514  ORF Transcript_28266/g.32514 Transcript_28266/m.32514 type:complete len:375 (+) Transcript_28266:51-1175(+)
MIAKSPNVVSRPITDNDDANKISKRKNRLLEKTLPPKNDNKGRPAVSLPLDWTRVKRRRRPNIEENITGSIRKNADKDQYIQTQPRKEEMLDDFCDPSCNSCIVSDVKQSNIISAKSNNLVKGMAIFCHHIINPSWFQGYFIPCNSKSDVANFTVSSDWCSRPVAILAKQRILSDCCECLDGGYKELNLVFYGRDQTGNRRGMKRRQLTLPATCTGGDMMHIRPLLDDKSRKEMKSTFDGGNDDGPKELQPTVHFDTKRVITGEKVTSYMKKYFSVIVRKASQTKDNCIHNDTSNSNDGQEDKRNKYSEKNLENARLGIKIEKAPSSISDLLPDCAIIIGDMAVSGLPSSFFSRDTPRSQNMDSDVDDDWMMAD